MTTSGSTEALQGAAYFRAAARLTWASWREMFQPRTIPANLAAGLTIALVALPLNLALALACGLPPAMGLVTGAIAGVLGALLGGSRLQVTGPEVALAPMTLLIVSAEGVGGLMLATFMCGLFQIAFGLLRLGQVVRRVPRPVIAGFMMAIGLLVFDTQLPRLLGLPREVATLHEVIGGGALPQPQPQTLAIGLLVMATIVLAPRLLRRAPGPLLGLAVAVLLAFAMPSVPRLDALPGTFPMPRLPDFGALRFMQLVPEALALAVLASIDSLLCAASVDARTGSRTLGDQELCAQGVANLASACLGGMPVAAAIVRSMAAIEAGASTRLAPLFQALCLALALLVFGAAVAFVPVVALAAILLIVGYRLLDVPLLRRLWALDRAEAGIALATAVAILGTDFVSGVAIGCALSLARFALAMARSLALLPAESRQSLDVLRLEGPLFFANQTLLERALEPLHASRGAVLDLAGVTAVDSSGAVALRLGLERLASESRPIWLLNVPDHAPWLHEELRAARSPNLRIARDARLEADDEPSRAAPAKGAAAVTETPANDAPASTPRRRHTSMLESRRSPNTAANGGQ